MIMEQLQQGQKQEWKSSVDERLIRTGCRDIWDSIFIAFREYRDLSPELQQEMIRKKTNTDMSPSIEWVDSFHKTYQQKYKDRSKDDNQSFQQIFQLLPLKLVVSEIVPYIQYYITQNHNLTMPQLQEEIIDKCVLLADYRQKKKNLGLADDELAQMVRDTLTDCIFNEIHQFSYDTLQQAMTEIEHQLIIISTEEKVLFDSKTWGGGVEGCDYQDVIILLAHPNNTYDSIGRLSYTKDGHQKISRLFHFDDDIVETLRK